MATIGGPNTKKDNVVFGYDTGYGVADYKTITRFFRGAPTINYIHTQNAVAQSSYTAYSATSSGTWNAKHPNAIRAYNAQGGDITAYINSGVNDWTNTYHAIWELDPILKKPVVVMNDVGGQWKAKSFATGLGSWTSQGKTHGDTYTISWLQWVDNLSKNAKAGLYTKNSSGSSGFHDGQANSASAYNTKTNTWQRVYQTYTTNSNRDLSETLASIYMYGHHNVRATVKIADVQFTWGSTPFPFSAAYERSSTQSLIDLKRTADIDLSNVSFDSTGQPEFDGTDDYIQIPDPNISSSNGFSIEMIIKPTNASSSPMVITPASGGIDHFVRFNNNGRIYMRMVVAQDSSVQDFTTTTSLSSTDYHHITFTFKQSEGGKAYYNGNQESAASANFTALDWSSVWKIGQRGNNTYFFDGELPILKVHNQVLSANEVKQNFNAYKNRFGI